MVAEASALDLGSADDARLRSLTASVRAAQRCLDGVTTKVGVRAGELADNGRSDGAASVLGSQGSVGTRTAQREAARADLVADVPLLGDAMATGSVSGEHADVLARRTGRLSDEERSALDLDALAARAAELPVDTFDAVVRKAVDAAKADHGLSDTVNRQAASEFRHWFDRASGMGRFSGAFDPECYEGFVAAIESRLTELANTSDEATAKNRNLAARAVHDLVTGGAGGRPSAAVGFVIDRASLQHGFHTNTVAQTVLGQDLPPESIARLCCDAVLRRVALDERGVPLNVGRRYRTATDAQWAAVKALHSTCAWAGCERPITWCQLHHIIEWEHGGRTDLCNLVPLCSEHHHRVHEGRWTIKLLPDRSLEIFRPDGALHEIVPPPSRNLPKLE